MRVGLKNQFDLNAGDYGLNALVVEPRFFLHLIASLKQSLASEVSLGLTCLCATHGVDDGSNVGVTLDDFFKLGQFFGNSSVFFRLGLVVRPLQ